MTTNTTPTPGNTDPRVAELTGQLLALTDDPTLTAPERQAAIQTLIGDAAERLRVEGGSRALRELAAEWRQAYSAEFFPCDADTMADINARAGRNATARVAAYFARHWADTLDERANH